MHDTQAEWGFKTPFGALWRDVLRDTGMLPSTGGGTRFKTPFSVTFSVTTETLDNIDAATASSFKTPFGVTFSVTFRE